MSRRVGDLAVRNGSYTKDGEEKNRYVNVGALMADDEGRFFILLDRTFNPAGIVDRGDKTNILISVFDIEDSPASS